MGGDPDLITQENAQKLKAALAALLDSVDYTTGACRPNEMVGAVLDSALIVNARAALAATEGR